jgi:hypothetical protein
MHIPLLQYPGHYDAPTTLFERIGKERIRL